MFFFICIYCRTLTSSDPWLYLCLSPLDVVSPVDVGIIPFGVAIEVLLSKKSSYDRFIQRFVRELTLSQKYRK